MPIVRLVSTLILMASINADDAVPTPATPPPLGVGATAPETTQFISLNTAIALALSRNETPKIAAARIDGAKAGLARARAALLPQLTIAGSLKTTAIDDLPHGGAANETAAWSASASIGLLKHSALSAYESARHSAHAQKLDSREMNRALAYAVGDVFLTVLAAERQVIAAERRLEVARSSVADAKARLQAGISTRTDVTRSELGEAQSQLALTQAKRAVVASREALTQLIVLDFPGSLAPVADIIVPSRNWQELHIKAVQSRDDLRALRTREQAESELVNAAYGRYVPDLTASAEVGNTRSTSPLLRPYNNDTNMTLALIATWTLYDGGDREGAIDAANARRQESGLNYTASLRAIIPDAKTAIADLTTAEDTLLQAEARDRLAQANAEEIRARYKQGLATALEDADAISGQFDAESGLVAARLDLQRSRLAIRRLVGFWPQSDRAPETTP